MRSRHFEQVCHERSTDLGNTRRCCGTEQRSLYTADTLFEREDLVVCETHIAAKRLDVLFNGLHVELDFFNAVTAIHADFSVTVT